MAMKKEALTNFIADDLAKRNENWNEIDNTFALHTTQLSEKVQNFTLENLIENGDFSDGVNGWIGGGSATVVSTTNNELVSVATIPYGGIYQSIPLLNTNKYYFYAQVKSDSASVRLYIDSTILEQHSGGNTYELLSGVYTSLANSTVNFRVRDGRTSVWTNVYSKYYGCINLTQIFGAGNEPTKEEMDELMKVVPNQWWDGELSLTQKQVVVWQLNLIRKNTNAIIALGGTII